MANSVNLTVGVNMSGSKTKTADKESSSVKISEAISRSYNNGTGSAQIDLGWSDTIALADGANTTLDLSNLVDPVHGDAIAFAKVKVLVIHNKDVSGQPVTIGNATNPFASWLGNATDTIVINPGECKVLINDPYTGFAVTPVTGDELKLANGLAGQACNLDVWIFGTSV